MGDGSSANSAVFPADSAYPISGYTRRRMHIAELVARNNVLDELANIIRRERTLYAWARGHQQSRALSGRAPVFVATLSDDAGTTIVVRHSWHGGLLAPITGDRFFKPSRAPLELMRSHMLRDCGIPTPEVIAFALYPAGMGFVRVDVATRYLPDSYDFAAVLSGLAPDVNREEAFAAIELLLRQLSRSGFVHPDLNIKNILLHRKEGAIVATVLDVDVMRWNQNAAAETNTQLNAERLLRSLLKARRQFGISFTDDEQNAFVDRTMRELPENVRVRNKARPVAGAMH